MNWLKVARSIPSVAAPKQSRMLSGLATFSRHSRLGLMQKPFGPTGVQIRFHGDDHVDPNAKSVHITFVKKDGSEQEVEGKVGQNLLRLAQKNGIELEGACEASLACSTCHVIFEGEVYDQLPYPSESEDDMLDMAFGLTETSRLGCQIELAEFMEGTKVTLPKATRNFYVDGHVPQPH